MKTLTRNILMAAVVGGAILTPAAAAKAPWAAAQISCAERIKQEMGDVKMTLVERKESTMDYKFLVKVGDDDEQMVTCKARKRTGEIREFTVEAVEA